MDPGARVGPRDQELVTVEDHVEAAVGQDALLPHHARARPHDHTRCDETLLVGHGVTLPPPADIRPPHTLDLE